MEEAEEKRAKEEAEKEAKMRKDMEESAKHRNKQVSCHGNTPVLVCVQTEISPSFYLTYNFGGNPKKKIKDLDVYTL